MYDINDLKCVGGTDRNSKGNTISQTAIEKETDQDIVTTDSRQDIVTTTGVKNSF